MMKFMFILMLLMAAVMAWWLVPVAFVIWFMFKAFSWKDFYEAAKKQPIRENLRKTMER